MVLHIVLSMEDGICPECNGSVISESGRQVCPKCTIDWGPVFTLEPTGEGSPIIKRDYLSKKGRRSYKYLKWRSQRERREFHNLKDFNKILRHLPYEFQTLFKKELTRDFKALQNELLDLKIKGIDEPFTILYHLLIKKTQKVIEKVASLRDAEKHLDEILLNLHKGDLLASSILALKEKYQSIESRASKDMVKIMKGRDLKFIVPLQIDPTMDRDKDPNFFRLIDYNESARAVSKIVREKPSEDWVTSPTGIKVKIGTNGEPRRILVHDGRRRPIARWKNRSKMVSLCGYRRFLNFLTHMPSEQSSRRRKGLFCACLYREAEEAWDISPESKKRWARFFNIDRKTLDKRLKDLEALKSI